MKILNFENNNSTMEIWVEVDQLHVIIYDKSGENEVAKYKMSRKDTKKLFDEMMHMEALNGRKFIEKLRKYADELEKEYE